MLTPGQFKVNEAWIAIRINESFLFVSEEPYDIYVLMDAASAYVFGHVLKKVTDEVPDEKDIHNLFTDAWGKRSQWAKKLIVSENGPAENAFRKQAEEIGLSIDIVPLSDLAPIVGPLKELFASDFA